MELEQLFIYFLLEEFGGEAGAPVCDLLKKRNFDLRCLFEWENLSLLIPLVIALFSAFKGCRQKGCDGERDNCDKTDKKDNFNERDSDNCCRCKPCLRPITSLANDKILTALDRYIV